MLFQISRSLRSILCTILFCSTALLSEQIPTGKTFYALPFGLDGRPSFSALNTLAHTQHHTSLTVQGFYFTTIESDEQNAYFGFQDTTTGELIGNIQISADNIKAPLTPQDILHDYENHKNFLDKTINPLSQTLSFHPTLSTSGVVIEGALLLTPSILFTISLPYIVMETNLGLQEEGMTKSQVFNGSAVTMKDYLQGKVWNYDTTSPNQQLPLRAGLFPSNPQTCEGIADITTRCSYLFHSTDTTQAAFTSIIVLPTTSGSEASILFEPVLGSHGHYYMGATCEGSYICMQTNDGLTGSIGGNIEIVQGIKSQERRSFGIRFASSSSGGTIWHTSRFGRYALAAQKGGGILFPLINVLTHEVDVSPGLQWNLQVHTTLASKTLQATAGYSYNGASAETVSLSSAFPDNYYDIASYDFSTYTTDISGTILTDINGALFTYDAFSPETHGITQGLQSNNLIMESAAIPTQKTHHLSLALTFTPESFFGLSLSCSASYYWASKKCGGVNGYRFAGGITYNW